jgi:beta-xylosidase
VTPTGPAVPTGSGAPALAATPGPADPTLPTGTGRPWQDASRPVEERVQALLAAMTLEEKLAQLGSVWIGQNEPGDPQEIVAPGQDQFVDDRPYEEATRHGVGHLTRVFGTAPVAPAAGARHLAELQRDLRDGTRLGIPAIAHEECLTGFTTYRASVFPTPLAWAAAFDPAAVEQMARAIGGGMRAVGVHQGLSPVLDVVRDYRWGRVEESLGEDPYLVGMVGTAYVRGLESAGVVATLKHLAGYSASRAGRNHAPAVLGRRELADVILPPFELAIREGGARSVMASYADVDGVPSHADEDLLSGLLRDRWGFDGVVVSDYWGTVYLQSQHRVAATPGEAGAQALRAGVDVELPYTLCFGEPLAELARSDGLPVKLVDRAVGRVLRLKCELGLLDEDWSPEPVEGPPGSIDLDPPANRRLARELAERSVILLANRGALPLPAEASVAVVGPCADDPLAFLGCYSFPNHVLATHPDLDLGVEVPSLLAALRTELPAAALTYQHGCPVQEPDRTGLADAVAAARAADVCVAVVGDRAGMFGRGTSGEGCDAEDLRLPGIQAELVRALLDTGTPVVLVVVSGRPYALGEFADEAAAIVQAFFPGEEGGPALAGVLSGRVVPSGKLPVQVPRHPGAQPGTYLVPPLGGDARMSNLDPTPLFAFGHGLSYTGYDYSDLGISAADVPTDGEVVVSCLVRNTGRRAGTEVVQLYLGDPVAQVARPVRQLAGFARVPLEPGAAARVAFRLHADRTAFTGVDLTRVVEPGEVQVWVGGSSADPPLHGSFRLTGPLRRVDHDRVLTTPVEVVPGA